MGDSYKAFYWQNRRLELCQRYFAGRKPFNQNMLARAYMSRGALNDIENDSLHDFNVCIRIMEKLHEKGQLYDLNNLAKAYMYRGEAYYDMSEFNDCDKSDEAIHDFDICIQLMKQLKERGILYDFNALAIAIIHRCRILENKSKYDEVQHDYEEAIQIMEGLKENGRLYNPDHLADAYLQRGDELKSLGLFEESLRDYNEAIRIMEELEGQFQFIEALYWHSLLSKGVLLADDLHEIDSALETFNKGVSMIQTKYSSVSKGLIGLVVKAGIYRPLLAQFISLRNRLLGIDDDNSNQTS